MHFDLGEIGDRRIGPQVGGTNSRSCPSGPQAATRRALGLVFCILLLDIIGISIMFPVAPYVVRRYSADALMLTVLTAVYASAQFVAAPVFGKLGDRYGRRPVLLVSLLGSAVGHVIFGVAGIRDQELLTELVSLGLRFVSAGTDVGFMAEAAGAQVRRLREIPVEKEA